MTKGFVEGGYQKALDLIQFAMRNVERIKPASDVGYSERVIRGYQRRRALARIASYVIAQRWIDTSR